jgi:alpha-mannosidase
MSTAAESRQAWYTFGNHFHWVDMQWKWGYGVLADSVADMLAFCAATGARGNVNFDAVGYEKMAAESPEALARLREAVGAGQVEVAGASYGQPYALFHGGESAVRQLSYGVRVAARLLGTPPRSFWEEEFFFFPQLPQLLTGTGFRYASLFFQWTWHTPHVPAETAPAIWWEGLDGSQILTAPRTSLALHQWPEDFAALRADPLLARSPAPVITQWLELLPSLDWMCRSELLLPGMAQLAAIPGIELRFGTLSEVLDGVREHAVPRRYTMDDVFHGMSLGKNGSLLHRRSRRAEETLLAAETLSVLAGRLGRPYPSWDVYPVWELEEGWRELLTAQHHDNDECEGLCGSIGYASLDRAQALADTVLHRTVHALAARLDAARVAGAVGTVPSAGQSTGADAGPAADASGGTLVVNQLGWTRPAAVPAAVIPPAGDTTAGGTVLVELPAAGWLVAGPGTGRLRPPATVSAGAGRDGAGALMLRRGALLLEVDAATGLATRLAADGTEIGFPAGLGALELTTGGRRENFAAAGVSPGPDGQSIVVRRTARDGHEVTLTFACAPERDAIDLTISSAGLPVPDPRYAAGLVMPVEPDLHALALWHDTPYAVTPVKARGSYPRKYPTGDWMTSPQVFEDIPGPFSALQLIDLRGSRGRALLWLHDGSQGYQRTERGIRAVLSVNDAWDEDYYLADLNARFRLLPHGPELRASDMWRLAREFTSPALTVPLAADTLRDGQPAGLAPPDTAPPDTAPAGPVPPSPVPLGATPRERALSDARPQVPAPPGAWSLLHADAPSVAVTAVYRETGFSAAASDRHVTGETDCPVLVRLVELDGIAARTTLTVSGTVRRAWRTDLLGGITGELAVTAADPGPGSGPKPGGSPRSRVALRLRGYEVATVALDIIETRKTARDLDASRAVWATVHRTDQHHTDKDPAP